MEDEDDFYGDEYDQDEFENHEFDQEMEEEFDDDELLYLEDGHSINED